MTNILIYSCASTFLAFWAGMIAWTVRKRQLFPWDIALAILILPLSTGMMTINDWKISLGWLAFFPLMVWPDSKPERYFFQKRGIGQSIYYGFSLGVMLAMLSLVPFWLGFINVSEAGTGFWVQAFSLFQHVVLTELTFRSLILGSLVYRGVPERIAAWLQASLYAILLLLGFLYSGQLAPLLFLATYGLIAGWITLRTRNIAGTILMHLIVYGTGLLLAYYY